MMSVLRLCNDQGNYKKTKQNQELQTLQVSVSRLNVKVHDSTIKKLKRLNKYSLSERVTKRNSFLSIKVHLNKAQDFQKNVL